MLATETTLECSVVQILQLYEADDEMNLAAKVQTYAMPLSLNVGQTPIVLVSTLTKWADTYKSKSRLCFVCDSIALPEPPESPSNVALKTLLS